MTMTFRLDSPIIDQNCRVLRSEVREFLAAEIAAGTFSPTCDNWLRGADRDFSRKLGAKGWLGMTWPEKYGGHGRSQLERFVVIEELLFSGAPVAAHWLAERQVGPSLLRHGSEEMKKTLVPPIARGESIFGACYSEPDVGSDLASVRMRAERIEGGWRLNGTKVWTSQGHLADHLIVLCRTSSSGRKHDGLSVLIITLPAKGVTIRPIVLLTGEHHFNEVRFDDVDVPDTMMLGSPGDGWKLVTADLAVERSGPERFMSTIPLLTQAIRKARGEGRNGRATIVIGELVSRLWTLRAMSIGVAQLMESGRSPDVEAALVKDLGTRFESELTEAVRKLYPVIPSLGGEDVLADLVAQSILDSPAFTLRGGTNEILRGIIARGLGVR